MTATTRADIGARCSSSTVKPGSEVCVQTCDDVSFDDDLAIGSFPFDVFRKDRIIRRYWASLPATTTKSYVKFNNRERLSYLWTFDGELLDILSSTSDSEINEKLRRVTMLHPPTPRTMVVSKLAANQSGSIPDVVLETRGLPLSRLDP